MLYLQQIVKKYINKHCGKFDGAVLLIPSQLFTFRQYFILNMNDEYYLLEDENKTGPFTYDEVTERDIDIHTRVLAPQATEWQYASELPEFNEYFESKGIYFPTADNLAKFGRRALAFIIDYLILFIPIEIIMIRMGLIILPSTAQFIMPSQHAIMVLQVSFSIAFLIYNTLFEAALKGSLGKKICRLSVVDIDGKSPSVAKAFTRNLGALLSLIIYGLPFLSILFSEHRQAWYDSLAKTYVIVKPAKF